MALPDRGEARSLHNNFWLRIQEVRNRGRLLLLYKPRRSCFACWLRPRPYRGLLPLPQISTATATSNSPGRNLQEHNTDTFSFTTERLVQQHSSANTAAVYPFLHSSRSPRPSRTACFRAPKTHNLYKTTRQLPLDATKHMYLARSPVKKRDTIPETQHLEHVSRARYLVPMKKGTDIIVHSKSTTPHARAALPH